MRGEAVKNIMRVTVFLFVFLLTACSSQVVRCERHLTPINPAQKVGDAFPGRALPLAKTTRTVEVRNASGKSQALPSAGAGGMP